MAATNRPIKPDPLLGGVMTPPAARPALPSAPYHSGPAPSSRARPVMDVAAGGLEDAADSRGPPGADARRGLIEGASGRSPLLLHGGGSWGRSADKRHGGAPSLFSSSALPPPDVFLWHLRVHFYSPRRTGSF